MQVGGCIIKGEWTTPWGLGRNRPDSDQGEAPSGGGFTFLARGLLQGWGPLPRDRRGVGSSRSLVRAGGWAGFAASNLGKALGANRLSSAFRINVSTSGYCGRASLRELAPR